MHHSTSREFWTHLRTGPETALSDDDFFALQVLLDDMTELELESFTSAPENEALLKLYRAYALRRMAPYVLALAAILPVSIVAGALSAV